MGCHLNHTELPVIQHHCAVRGADRSIEGVRNVLETGSNETGHAEHFAFVEVKGDIGQSLGGQVSDLEHDTAFLRGAAITLDPGTGKPVHFIIGDKVQVLGPDGKVLAATDVKKNAKVHVHLVADGDRTVVDKITVDNAQ